MLALLMRCRTPWAVAACGTTVALFAAWTMSPLPPWQLGRLGSPTDAEWSEVGLYLTEHSAPGEPVFVQSGLVESSLIPLYAGDLMFMEYVACRVSRFYLETHHPRYGLPFSWDVKTGVQDYFRNVLPDIKSSEIANGAAESFWIAAATDTDLNRNSLAGMQQVALSAGAVLKEHRTWPNVRLARYAMSDDH